ncbi:MAG TPA: metalloregulator ArsR/SmtB family transcription factor [Gemmatimonadales bacterium]|jgi:DNA-binding transcriptional ArsR family regulator
MVTRNSPTPDAVFRALADPTRRAILGALARGSQPVGALAQRFPVSRPAISRHLRVLRRARLVRDRREGRHRVCELTPGPLREVDAWLSHYRRFWQARLARLKRHLEADT